MAAVAVDVDGVRLVVDTIVMADAFVGVVAVGENGIAGEIEYTCTCTCAGACARYCACPSARTCECSCACAYACSWPSVCSCAFAC